MSLLNQVVINQFFSSLEKFITAGTEYGEALKKLAPLYNKAKPAEQIEIRNRVVQLVGKKYGAKPTMLEAGAYKGSLGFDSRGDDAQRKARAFLRNNFNVKVVVDKSSTKKAVVKQVDKVEQALALVESMTKAEQTKFRTRVTYKK
jgi:predicted transcriptional regulator